MSLIGVSLLFLLAPIPVVIAAMLSQFSDYRRSFFSTNFLEWGMPPVCVMRTQAMILGGSPSSEDESM